MESACLMFTVGRRQISTLKLRTVRVLISAPTWLFTTIFNSASRKPDDFLRTQGTHTYWHAQDARTHKIEINQSLKKKKNFKTNEQQQNCQAILLCIKVSKLARLRLLIPASLSHSGRRNLSLTVTVLKALKFTRSNPLKVENIY